MKSTRLISVVIPAYNAAKHLSRAIDSILLQKCTDSIEIIIVDDGSKDQTAEMCRAYGEKIRYYHQENQGVSIARNQGVAHARGEIVVFLDADDFLASDAVNHLTHPLWENSFLGGCSGIVYMQGSSNIDFFRPPQGMFSSGQIDLYSFIALQPIPTASGVAVRKSSFTEVGGFTSGMRFGEDMELWNKIYGKYDWYFVSEVVATYCRSDETSVTCQTPFYDHGLDYIWTEEEMRKRARPEHWESYREYKKVFLLAKARLSLHEGAHTFGLDAVGRIDAKRLNLNYLKWKATYLLPRPLWKILRSILIEKSK